MTHAARAFLCALGILACSPAIAQDPGARAIENEARIWRAISGDVLELDGERVRLHGVSCPSPDTETGRAAKALLNTFLRGGKITCAVSQHPDGASAVCSKEARDMAQGLLASGLCQRKASEHDNPRPSAHMARQAVPPTRVLSLQTATRDRTFIDQKLCRQISAFEEPTVRFRVRCTQEALQLSVDEEIERLLSRDDEDGTVRIPQPLGSFLR